MEEEGEGTGDGLGVEMKGEGVGEGEGRVMEIIVLECARSRCWRGVEGKEGIMFGRGAVEGGAVYEGSGDHVKRDVEAWEDVRTEERVRTVSPNHNVFST